MLSQQDVLKKHIRNTQKADHSVMEAVLLHECGRVTLSACSEDDDCGCGNDVYHVTNMLVVYVL